MVSESTGYAAMDEIIAIYVVTRTYGYRIACRDRWHRYRHPDGGVRYRRVDVDRSLATTTDARREKATARLLAKRSSGE